jgi:soluble lytic murein transglycosylase-like protein
MKTQYKNTIIGMTQKHLPQGYDPRLVAAQIQQESNFCCTARSPVGAQGLMQIMPATWAEETKALKLSNANPDHAQHNIEVGCYYMAKRLKGWSAPRPSIDRLALALASYNAGFGHLLKAQKLADGANDYATIIAELPNITGKHATETRQYVERILTYYNEYVIFGW